MFLFLFVILFCGIIINNYNLLKFYLTIESIFIVFIFTLLNIDDSLNSRLLILLLIWVGIIELLLGLSLLII